KRKKRPIAKKSGGQLTAAAVRVARFSVRTNLVPRIDDVAPEWCLVCEAFGIMDMEVTVHLHRLCDAGADEVRSVVAAATECKIGIGRVNDAGERGVAIEAERRVAGQAVILKGQSITILIYHTVAGDRGRRRRHIHL